MNPMYEFIQRNRVLARIEKAQCTKATNLSLEDFDLCTIPDVLFKCTDLVSLNLGHNKLTILSILLNQLKNLQHITLEYNDLKRFPVEELQELTHLKTLNISHNAIGSLANINKLVNLEVLWCNHCCLTNLPDEIGNLSKLDTFGARHNQITALPDSICNLSKLRWLTLEGNKLYMLPKRFNKLEELIHLNLNKNNFGYIPNQLTKMKSLHILHLQSNEFFAIPEAVVNQMENVKINLMNNPFTTTLETQKSFPNLMLPGHEPEMLMGEFVLDSDSSCDWDNSLASSELNNYLISESDTDGEDAVLEVPGKFSKFLVTF